MSRIDRLTIEEIKASLINDSQKKTALPSFNEQNLLLIVRSLAEKVQKIDGERGSVINAAVTLKDLYDLGLVSFNFGGQVTSTSVPISSNLISPSVSRADFKALASAIHTVLTTEKTSTEYASALTAIQTLSK